MRRTDFLIAEARRISRNEANPDGTKAIVDESFLQALNDAQDRLQALISSQKITQKLFVGETIISLVAGTESYAIPDRLFLNKGIHQVEFSADGGLGNYTMLEKIATFNRDTNSSEYPVGYSVRGGLIYVTPIPSSSSGRLRVLYERSLDDLDIRRGKVSSVAGLSSTTFTSLVVDSTADETSTPNLSTIDYVCIVSVDGERKAFNIPVLSYDTGTNTLTPRAGFTFAKDGDTIEAGDYIVFGKYRTTHSQLPDDAEQYLIHYAARAHLGRDSSEDIASEDGMLQEMEKSILKGVVSQTGEIERVPQLNSGEWW